MPEWRLLAGGLAGVVGVLVALSGLQLAHASHLAVSAAPLHVWTVEMPPVPDRVEPAATEPEASLPTSSPVAQPTPAADVDPAQNTLPPQDVATPSIPPPAGDRTGDETPADDVLVGHDPAREGADAEAPTGEELPTATP